MPPIILLHQQNPVTSPRVRCKSNQHPIAGASYQSRSPHGRRKEISNRRLCLNCLACHLTRHWSAFGDVGSVTTSITSSFTRSQQQGRILQYRLRNKETNRPLSILLRLIVLDYTRQFLHTQNDNTSLTVRVKGGPSTGDSTSASLPFGMRNGLTPTYLVWSLPRDERWKSPAASAGRVHGVNDLVVSGVRRSPGAWRVHGETRGGLFTACYPDTRPEYIDDISVARNLLNLFRSR